MNHQTNSQNMKSSTNKMDQKEIETQDPQPESGFIDRQEEMSVRQSSPTNPRVNNKPEDNQEEA